MSLDIGNRLGHDDVTALIGEGGSVCRGQRRIGAFGGELITSPRFAQHPDSLRPGSRPTCLQLCNCSDYPASPSPVSGLDQNSLRHHVENGLGFAGFYSHFLTFGLGTGHAPNANVPDAPVLEPTRRDMRKFLVRLTVEEEGQDLIEYALLAAFISIASVAMITSIGTGVNSVYTATNTQVQAAATAAA